MKQKAIFVVGTTGSGKSAWALEAAQDVEGAILNCDSIQAYAGLQVGSAAPNASERKICPHHLFSYVEAPETLTAGRYRRDHLEKLSQLDQPVLVVGGTGFYFQSLEFGMFRIPAASTEIQSQIEQELLEKGENRLWEELQEKDPLAAKRIHPRDHYRLVRALEVIRQEGRALSEIRLELEKNHEKYPRPYLKLGIVWEKSELEKRVRARSEAMIRGGLIEETRALLDQGLADWAPLQSVGYKECVLFLQENQTKDWLLEEMCRATMKLAKKQRTWFQRDQNIFWFPGASGKMDFKGKIQQFLDETGT